MHRSVRSILQLGSALGLLASVTACDVGEQAKAPLGAFSLLGGTEPAGWPMNDTGYGLFSQEPSWSAPLPGEALPMRAHAPDEYRLAPVYDYRAGEPSYYDAAPYTDNYAPYTNNYAPDADDYPPYADGYDYEPEGYSPDAYWNQYHDADYYDDRNYLSDPSSDSFAWLALASALTGILGNSPPDYYFDHGGVQPWVWETGDHYRRYAEPIGPGYRYYFYEPGAVRPFLVRDPFYSYGYREDRLVVIYDRDGRVLDHRRADRHRRAAAYYYDRARDLHGSSRRRPHHGVSADRWAQRRSWIAREQRQWERAREQRPQWRQWSDDHRDVIRTRWSGEQAARRYAARQFDDWRADGLRGPAPRFYAEARKAPEVRRAVALQRAAEHRDDLRERSRDRQRQARADDRRLARAQMAQARRQSVSDHQEASQRSDTRAQRWAQARVEQAQLGQQAKVHRQAQLRERTRANQQAQQREQAKEQRQARVRERTRATQQAQQREQAKAQRQAQVRERTRATQQAQQREQTKAQRQAQVRERTRATQQAQQREQAKAQRQAQVRERTRTGQQAQQREQAKVQRQAQVRERARASQQAQQRKQADAQRQAQARERTQARAQQAQQREQAKAQRQAQMRERARASQQVQQRQQASAQRQAQVRERAQAHRQASVERRAQGRERNAVQHQRRMERFAGRGER